MHPSRLAGAIAGLAIVLPAAHVAADEIIYETADPFGSPFGLIGFDVFTEQSVAVRFTPAADATLARVSAWFMSNASVPQTRPVTLTIQTDAAPAGFSQPSGDVLETLELIVTAIGWDPQLDTAEASGTTLLRAGETYWLVAEGDFARAQNPVWNWATGVTGYTSTTTPAGAWQQGGDGAVPGLIIEGDAATACPADLDGDGELTLFDFLAFQNLFDAGDPAADFDGDGSLTLFDFLAFQNAFDAGCP
ncbi:MAG: GC-type dockerin domain-anchored protein [Planctomycetota bacterium]